MEEMKYLSLFSGVGGFEQGIGELGECVGFSEIDKYAIQTYEKHFKEHINYGDATKINERELPDFDLLVGGFPCQAFSIAGKRKGFDDTRGTLFFDIARILSYKRPRHFVLENVKGLLSHNSGKTFQTILGVLADLGYGVEWQVLNGKRWVPQNRERIIIVGHLRGECSRKIFPFGGSEQQFASVAGYISEEIWPHRHEQIRRVYNTNGAMPTIPTGQGGGVMTKIIVPRNHRTKTQTQDISSTLTSRFRGVPDGDGRPAIIRPVLTPDRLEKRQNGRRMKENGEPAFTLNTQDIHGIYNGARIRRLTPLECERLMGWEDGWTEGVSDTQRYKQCGNGIIAPMVTEIMTALLREGCIE